MVQKFDLLKLSFYSNFNTLKGLLMAQRIKTWDSSSYLKLSAILEMYYSENGIHGDHIYRACSRLHNYKDHVDYAMLKEQVFQMSVPDKVHLMIASTLVPRL